MLLTSISLALVVVDFGRKKLPEIVQAPMVLPVVLVIFFPWFQWLRRDSKSNNQ
jgi:hypothetical protein